MKEAGQIAIFEQLRIKKLTQRQASKILRLSTRQIKRKYKSYVEHGPRGLINKSRGKPSNRALNEEKIKEIIHILETKLIDFGPTLAKEKLSVLHKITISSECLRQLMIKHNLWNVKKEKKKVHVWRERKHCLGELVQSDGSKHLWFNNKYYMILLPFCRHSKFEI